MQCIIESNEHICTYTFDLEMHLHRKTVRVVGHTKPPF